MLTAGLGTRLHPLTGARAKPAIPVAGVPMIRRIIAWLAGAGITDLVLNLHHLPDTLTATVGDATDLSARVRYSWEPTILGSAGGPKRALPLIDADPFFVINGDTLTDVDLSRVAAAHEHSGALVTLAVTPNREPDRYGGVVLGTDQRVAGFVRRGPGAAGSFHFVGVQVVARDAFAAAPPDRPSQSIGDIYDRLIAADAGSVRAFVCDAQFHDVGTVADYVRASRSFAGSSTANMCGARVTIASTARVARSILWDDVEVGDRCLLEDCVVTDAVRIPAGTTHRRVAIARKAGSDELLVEPIPE